MRKLTIKNVGPINAIEIELNKINILMGSQSSGKSTIAKILSYCQWVEKRYILDGKYEYDVFEQLLAFHRLGKNYFSGESFFEYESDFVKISYRGVELEQSIVFKDSDIEYKKTKNIYIPSERNFVSAIPNLSKYKETNDNVMSFVYDWYTAKRKFVKSNLLPILNLGVSFYHNEEGDLDLLLLNGIEKEIQLREGSSGLQSLTPLTIIVEYLTGSFYTERPSLSVEEKDNYDKFLLGLIGTNIKSRATKNGDNFKMSEDEANVLAGRIVNRFIYNYTNFIIEEPEQNLFPETQRDFIYYIFSKLTSTQREHSLLITTHSPYILYAINNCLLGARVSKQMPDDEKLDLLSKASWISSDLVNVWELKTADGKSSIHSIKSEDSGTVSKHYFNKVMNSIMDEYYEMLHYLEHD